MSLFEAVERRGTWALLQFAAALAVFLALHLLRIPLVLLARVLEIAARRVDSYAARQAASVPAGPINHFYPTREEHVHVRA